MEGFSRSKARSYRRRSSSRSTRWIEAGRSSALAASPRTKRAGSLSPWSRDSQATAVRAETNAQVASVRATSDEQAAAERADAAAQVARIQADARQSAEAAIAPVALRDPAFARYWRAVTEWRRSFGKPGDLFVLARDSDLAALRATLPLDKPAPAPGDKK